MKLVMVTPYFRPVVGGLEHYAEQVARGLMQRGWEVHIITSANQAGTEVMDGLTIHRLSTWAKLANTPLNPLWPWQIRRLLKQLQPDVLNLHAPVPSLAAAAWLVHGRTPVVITYHAGSMKKGRPLLDGIIRVFESGLLPRMLNSAGHIIVASEFVKRSFLSRWQAKITVITPAVDTQNFAPAPSGYNAGGPIVFVGDSRDPRKGLEVLLTAMHSLPANRPLRVVGPSHPVSQTGVTFTGPKTGQALIQEMQGASMLVLPSITEAESFGMVLLEAMACGIPVIGTQMGGIPTLVQDGKTGLLVPAQDPQALAEAIEKLLTDTKLATRLGAAGRQTALTQYQWNNRVTATAAILEAAHVQSEVQHG